MKTILACFYILFFVSAFSFQSFCQSKNIIADKKPFKYLIGKEYSEVSELGDFDLNGRGSRGKPDGIRNSHANLIKGDKYIITSEKSWLDENTNKEIHKILDIIVLNGKHTTCGGCLLSNNKGSIIKSIYPYGTTDHDSVLIAFKMNRRTGKYKQVNPDKLERNPNNRSNFK